MKYKKALKDKKHAVQKNCKRIRIYQKKIIHYKKTKFSKAIPKRKNSSYFMNIFFLID